MLCDAHIHVGQYFDIYTSPSGLSRFLREVGVERYAVSSTTMCEENYRKVLRELKELQRLDGDRMRPVLWVTPRLMESRWLDRFLRSGLDWAMVKIHPQLHPTAWACHGELFRKVAALAEALNVPLLIHTGEREGCYPSLFEPGIREHPRLRFIMAHSRPVKETIALMQRYPNVWSDLAFTPAAHAALLVQSGLRERVLWGTDYPIPRHFYRDKDMVEHYRALLSELQSAIPEEAFESITTQNFKHLLSGAF